MNAIQNFVRNVASIPTKVKNLAAELAQDWSRVYYMTHVSYVPVKIKKDR